MVAVGREFQFPIDFSANKHWELTSSPARVTSYSRDLADRLSACREVADLLVREARTWHREWINSLMDEFRSELERNPPAAG